MEQTEWQPKHTWQNTEQKEWQSNYAKQDAEQMEQVEQ